MAKINKYGIRDLQRDFPSDEVCLEFIFDTLHSRKCSCGGRYSLIKGRRQFQCSKCRFQVAPTSGTIFHKSDTPLTLWLYAIFLFSNAKSGLSAKQLERELNTTYKTAWRILTLIRKSLKQSEEFLSGDVEIDETYLGGKGKAGRDNRGIGKVMRAKSVIIGAVERGGRMRAEVSPNVRAKSIGSFLDRNVNPITSRLLTDSSDRYDKVARNYRRERVNHSEKEWMRGDIHVNNVESFWSHVKRSVKGTHKSVSKKHLQSYVDGFVFHYNNRHSDSERFSVLLGALLSGAK